MVRCKKNVICQHVVAATILLIALLQDISLASTEIANGCNTWASSEYNSNWAAYGHDNNTGTRWESNHNDGEWLILDFGANKYIDSMEIEWEVAKPGHCIISGSTDQVNYYSIKDTTAYDGTTDHQKWKFKFPWSPSYHYIKITGVTRATTYGTSIWECRVWSDAAGNKTKANNATSLNAGGSWTGGFPPYAKDGAVWNSTVNSSPSPTIGDDAYWNSLTYSNTSGTNTIAATAGKYLNIYGGGIDMSSASVDLTISASMYLGDNQTWNIASGRTLTMSGILGGGNTLTKSGTGTLTLTGTNTYSGTTTVSAGTLNINNGSAIGTGTLTISGGTINNTSGNGIVISNSNPQNWNGDFTFTGSDNLNLGTGTVSLSANRIVTVSANTLTAAGVISGAYTLTKAGTGTLQLSAANSYSGATTISGGILAANTINNGAIASSIGASASGAANLVLDGGTLQYTGATTSTDRLFILNTTGGTIDASGTGPLSFTSNNSISINGSGARTLTLTGTNTGSNTLGLILGDNGGATALVKNGTGTWVLSNANTYTGTTTISAGKLIVNGSASTGAVSVAAGTTLGGTGTVAGALTVSNTGTIQPTTSGTAGKLTLSSATSPVFNSTSTLKLRITSATNNDTLNLSNASAVFTATNVALVIDPTGLSDPANGITIVQVAKGSGGISGTFASVTCSNGAPLVVHYNTTTITVDIVTNDDYSDWNYSRKIRLNTYSTGANVQTNQDSFPVLIRLNGGNFNFAQAQDSGQDIRFSKSNGTHMPYEIDNWDQTNQNATIWVRPDTVYGNNSTQYIIMYWGNQAAGDSSKSSNVFLTSKGFVGVWHLNDGGTGKRPDATANKDSAKCIGTTFNPYGGNIGGCDTFVSSIGQYDSVANGPNLSGSNLSVSGWFKLAPGATAYNRVIVGQGTTSADHDLHFMYRQSTNKLSFAFYSDDLDQTNTFSGGTDWHYAAGTFNTTTKAQKLYYDGALDNSRTATGNYAGTGALLIGWNPQGDRFDGNLDEIVVANTDRSADWIKLCYENQKSNQTLVDMEDYSKWSYYKNINLNTTASGAAVANNVYNFPVLVRLSSANFDFTKAQDAGGDLRFAKSNGDHLSYVIDAWDRANQIATVWVKLDTVYGNNGSQYFTMYWGNSSVSAMDNGNAVFDSANGYVGVWHFPTASPLSDATVRNLSLTDNATGAGTGIIGDGRYFATNGDYLNCNSAAGALDFAGASDQVTFYAWVKPTAVASWQGIFTKGTGSSTYDYWAGLSNTGGVYFRIGSNTTTSTATLTAGNWYLIAWTWDHATKKMYINGALDPTTTAYSTNITDNGNDTRIGIKMDLSTDYFTGYLDELRICRTAQSADWVKLCYQNQRANQTLVDLDDYSKWTYSKNIIINTSSMGLTGNVLGFPYLVRLNSTNFDFSQALGNGQDIRFSKANGTHFPYEIERWSNSEKLAEIWVLVDTVLQSSSTQYFTMYWGKPNATNNSNSAAVFDTANGFVAVYHLNDVNVTTGYNDATANGLDATGHGMAVTDTISSVIAKGQVFNGSSKYLSIASGISLNAKKFTLSAWVKRGSTGTLQEILSQGSASTDNCVQLNFTGGDNFSFGFWNDDAVTAGAYSSTATWYNWATTFNPTGTAQIIYLNGAQNTTRTAGGSYAGTGEFDIGRYLPTTNGYFNGIINELRVEDTVRSADWIKLCYNNQVTGSTVTTLDSADAFRPLSLYKNAGMDTVKIWTTRWGMKFLKAKGGGIGFMGPDTAAASNQVDANLFYLLYNGQESDVGTGTLTLLDNTSVFARVSQNITVASQPFTIDYTVLGSGKMYARITTYAASPLSGGLEFRIANNATVKYDNTQFGTVSNCYGVLHSDTAAGKLDALMVPFQPWTQADQITTNSKYTGIKSSTWSLPQGNRQTWEFMIDFSHLSLHDSATAYRYVNEYQNPDTLSWYTGTPLCEKAWEKYLVGHWKFDEHTGDTAGDASASMSGTGYYGRINGGGKWTNGMWGNGDSLDGTDSIRVWPGASSNFNSASRGFTVMGWVKPATLMTTASCLFRQMNSNNGYSLAGSATGTAVFKLGNGSSTRSLPSIKVLTPGQWWHVAGVQSWSKDTMKIFINGVLDSTCVIGAGYPTACADSVTMGNGFSGVLDDFRFYQSNLSDQEIRAIYLKGFSPDKGMYSVRADNSNAIQCIMHGGNMPRTLPVFQIANDWKGSLPTYVYVDTAPQTINTDYYAALDNNAQMLTIGFNQNISSNSTIYVGDAAIGATLLSTMPKMDWGQVTVGGSPHVWVKNFDGNYFGSASAKNFFFDWKMTYGNSTNTKNGDLWWFSSSAINPNANLDTTANTNLCQGYDGVDISLGTFTFKMNSSDYPNCSRNCPGSFTYSIAESSSVRVKINVNTRTITNGASSYTIDTRWTIYPTGQIWKWDSISTKTSTIQSALVSFGLNDATSPTTTIGSPKAKLRGAVHSTALQDFVAAITSFRNATAVYAQPFDKDTLVAKSDATKTDFDFVDSTTATNTKWGTLPVQVGSYIDIQSNSVTTGHMDSIGCSVQHFPNPSLTMTTGSLTTNTVGDLAGDGFNEREGAYIVDVSSSANTAQFTVLASGTDTSCRYNPAFRITGYTGATDPQYVYVGGVLKTKDYGYNSYVNKAKNELLLQLNQTICSNTVVYISFDKTLAVSMVRFQAFGGDRNDTLRWRTESEDQNLGFNLYRRVKPAFLDSALAKSAARDADTADNVVSYLRKGFIKQEDTGWAVVNAGGILRGARQGKSYGAKNYSFVDYRVFNDIRYEYKIEAVDFNNNKDLYKDFAEVMPKRIVPTMFDLSGNYPNPFRFATMIRYALPIKTKVDMNIFTIQGRLIRKLINAEKQDAGFYRIGWDGKDDRGRPVASGPFIYRMTTPQFSKSHLMILAK